MRRVVVDPGVLIAAAIAPHGLCRRLLQVVLDDRCTLIASPLLLAELERVILRTKFRRYLSAEQAQVFVALIAQIADVNSDPVERVQLSADPDDDYLLALARDTEADALISGDPHLTRLRSPQPRVLTPRAFLELVVD